ncbi:hypothetical protein HYU89_00860 [Candidatus Collierbacteria bacterium]|nr:hypothetical protein [Candidatus Collierbacteria bacterium]
MITFIVALEGITQVITYRPIISSSREEIKLQGLKILKKLGLTLSVPAAGVIFVSRDSNILRIDPVVWVRDIKTLFYETACASGTTAVALTEFFKQSKNTLEIPILQPSGKKLIARVKNLKQEVSAEIGGKIKILKKNLLLNI